MNIFNKISPKNIGVTGCLFFAVFGTQSAVGQVTPSELSRLSLEELLGVEISDISAKKRWLLSYEFRYLDVGMYQTGTTRLSFDEVLFSPGEETRTSSTYPIVPTFIKQRVHAFSVGREISNKLTLSLTVPLVSQETDHISSAPGFANFLIDSSGVGDVALIGQYKIHRSASASTSVGLGISLPTGSINQRGDTPRAGAGTLERLPYTMQIGSGTYDFLVSMGHESDVGDWAVGISGSATLRTGRNEYDYRLGNNYGAELTARFKRWSKFRPGLFINIRTTGEIRGQEQSLIIPGDPFLFGASITDSKNFGGEKAQLGGNMRLCLTDNCGLNVNMKASVPIYQNLNGIQPRERFSLSTAINYSF